MRELIEKVAYIAMRIKEGNVYFFDKEGICRRVSTNEAKEMKLRYLYVREDGSIYIELRDFAYYIKNVPNEILIRKAICKLNPGDEIKKFEEYLQNIQFDIKDKPKGLDRFITKIQKPIFVKKPENINTNTFDYIYIDINILSEWEEERKEYIKEHCREIYERIISKLKDSKEFEKYGVPVNFLKIGRITLTKSNILQFVLELKEI